ncbi:hypothetical protein skT53_30620 [Effusibacillus dendaii]|uniref:SCO family protein n=1 Tax=Effusibacillus dendaii TaxID=2743772 RepID=A0A7I8DDH7_9BACL|nr:hypothetical protein skT53_30620 [Effusibacillus dendaii]
MRGNHARIANKRILTLIIVILSLAFAGGLAYWIAWGFTRLPVVNAAPNWTLQNINGQRQSFQDLAPKVKLVEFIYLNCPDICPTTTINMVSI